MKHTGDNILELVELSQELARIAWNCSTCREQFKQVVQNYKVKKERRLSDSSDQEDNQTVVLNPNNDFTGAAISNAISTH